MLAALVVSACFSQSASPSPADAPPVRLLTSGFADVLEVEWPGGAPEVRARHAIGGLPGLPADLTARFGTTAECKTARDGAGVLVASSGGAVALLDPLRGQVSFAAAVHNAHSAELLPGGRLVAAASVGDGGDRLVVFDLATGAEVQEFPLPSAHGVVIDAERGRLAALGYATLLTFDVDAVSGELALRASHSLPDEGGHDLAAVPGSRELLVTTAAHVWLFDRDTETFRLHPRLGGLARVKSVDVHPLTHRIAYVVADEGEWWSTRVRFANPDGELALDGERFYKARWARGTGAAEGPPEARQAQPAPGNVDATTLASTSEAAPASVSIAFGSCADEDGDTARVWRLLGALAPDVLVLLGDTPYIDSTATDVQRRRHREFAAFPPFADLARSTPMAATWDDHDFGLNDTDGRMAGKERSRAAFVEARSGPPFLPRPGGEYGEGGAGIYTSFRRGPVEVFLLDTRWFARTAPSEFDPEQPTLLGAAQWAWLRRGLAASSAPFKVLACGMIWNNATRPFKTDHWGAYPAEFDGLCRFLGEGGIEGVVLVGGDIHRAREVEHDTAETVGYPLTELISSPMHGRVIAAANAPHPGLRFDSGAGQVVLVLAATASELRAMFHTPDGLLHTRRLTLSALGG